MTISSCIPSTVRRQPLAACIAVLFALVAPEAVAANTWTVTNCNDSGPGSLRAVIAAPTTLSGDTVDLSKLRTTYACSRISLHTGAITVAQDSLTLLGPGDLVGISGKYNGTYQNDRVFNHTGNGELSLQYLDIYDGRLSPVAGPANGGCIASNASVSLFRTQVFGCTATAPGGAQAHGGGIYVRGFLSLRDSAVFANKANSGNGGGLWAGYSVSLASSTISGNTATGSAGGAYAGRGAGLLYSTISGNAAATVGGVLVNGHVADDRLNVIDSTISGNSATAQTIGGVESLIPTTVKNSTIAFNTAVMASNGMAYSFAPGLTVTTGAAPTGTTIAVELQSSILSNNTYGSGTSATELDFSSVVTPNHTLTISGANNLVRAALGPVVPATTTSCPLLGTLRDNGGPTQTHALMSRSPAINTGNNAANLGTDQRGTGYPRVSGAAADIGAYEVQQADIVFNNGFDGCPTLF
ncbi:choice-of-anchor Q domain-containing protein [Dokdonella soli]|uniref:Right-handed parallel beta-helix repeat-containing protein n=1 Tax=Dokdonella soli TaxID=529810 RepID=A0ABN1IHL5_9GAMM